MYVHIIGDRDTVIGFKLAGVIKGTIIESSYEAKKIIDGYLLSSDIGIIIITETIFHDLEDFILEIKTKRRTPIITAIPDRKGSRDDIITIDNLLRKSFGFRS
ncbi:MAG: V-type ATP synthase subunit F [Candidatus Lokiarchaeota archaeon]|nr:V-type ATP synthase subunit F [Candidatus Lokiarchaeota archaeon]